MINICITQIQFFSDFILLKYIATCMNCHREKGINEMQIDKLTYLYAACSYCNVPQYYTPIRSLILDTAQKGWGYPPQSLRIIEEKLERYEYNATQ